MDRVRNLPDTIFVHYESKMHSPKLSPNKIASHLQLLQKVRTFHYTLLIFYDYIYDSISQQAFRCSRSAKKMPETPEKGVKYVQS